MIYPEGFESKIGFDRVRGQISALCTTQTGVDKLSRENFTTSATTITSRLSLADELKTVLMLESGFSSSDWNDIEPVAKKAKVQGAFLTAEDLVVLRGGLTDIDDIVEFFASRNAQSYPTINRLIGGTPSFEPIRRRIDAIIDRYGEVKDNASPELADIRREIRSSEGRINKQLQKVLQAAQSSGIVDADASISMRDGRAVIPVAAGDKRKLKGFIAGESATGKTVFIEPIEVVEINNRLMELISEQKREIIRILTIFTQSLEEDIESIEQAGDLLTTLDMVRAKARWAVENMAGRPIISSDNRLYLKDARHPLLSQNLAREGKQIVPLTLTLDKQKRILVISGPNAGGKSVCLKTVGLLQYMFQCGIPVSASEVSEMPLFDSIFIDIGDEQSIDNDLSTYSSHLQNMKSILAKATDSSLILIDEFGTGTEPVIGGAIAEAVLEKLCQRGTYGVITTHYSNLKYFASTTEGIASGAMMFDVQRIEPLFRLETGTAGSSFAMEIARKIGLPEEIIEIASEKAGKDHIDIEKQLRDIARDRRYWEQKRERIRLTDRKVEQMEQSYAQSLEKIRAERNAIIREAKEQAKTILADANKQIENTIRTIKESDADKELTRLARHELETFKAEVNDTSAEQDKIRIDAEMERVRERQQRRAQRKGETEQAAKEEPKDKIVPIEIAAGVKVRLEGQDSVGQVESVKGKKAVVAFGQILTTVELSRLTAVSNSEFKRQHRSTPLARVNVDISERKLNFKPSIDVRGMRAAEALEAVEDFVDNAVMVGVDNLRVLHGKGTGALQTEIRRYLRNLSVVESAADEHIERGGSGITIVTIKS